MSEVSEEDRKSRVQLIAEAVVAIISAGLVAILVAPRFIPNAEQVVRWPRFWIAVILLWYQCRVDLPEAWHHRRDDFGGLAFVLGLIALSLAVIWSALYPGSLGNWLLPSS